MIRLFAELSGHYRFGDVAKTKCSFCIHVTPRPLFQVCPTPFSGLLKAAGTGITLHAADYVFLLDPWWNPAVEAQAIDRSHRIGQTRTVNAYRLIAPGTVEEKIWDLQQRKAQTIQDVLGEEGFARSLSHTDLEYLFAED